MPLVQLAGASPPAAPSDPWPLRAHFDWPALASDTWGDGTESVTPAAGSVEDPVDWTLENADQSDTWGPNGSTGIVFEPGTGTGDWFAAAAPACMAMRASVADLIGSTPNQQTEIIVMSTWSGALAVNYQGRGCALREGSHVFQAREQYDSAAKLRFWRGVATSWAEVAASVVPTWHAIRLRSGVAECWYGTGSVPSTAAAVLAGTRLAASSADAMGAPSASASSFDMATADVYLYSMLAVGGTTLESVCTDLYVWEHVNS